MKPSAAQRAAEYFDQRYLHGKITFPPNEGADLATDLLREDRERRQGIRASIALDKWLIEHSHWLPTKADAELKMIASRLAIRRLAKRKEKS